MGYLLAEAIESGNRVIPTSSSTGKADVGMSFSCLLTPCPATCGISRVWVATSARRRGIATAMLDGLCQVFVPGRVLSSDELAFSDPTDDGRALALRYTRREDFMVYKWRVAGASGDLQDGPVHDFLKEQEEREALI